MATAAVPAVATQTAATATTAAATATAAKILLNFGQLPLVSLFIIGLLKQ